MTSTRSGYYGLSVPTEQTGIGSFGRRRLGRLKPRLYTLLYTCTQTNGGYVRARTDVHARCTLRSVRACVSSTNSHLSMHKTFVHLLWIRRFINYVHSSIIYGLHGLIRPLFMEYMDKIVLYLWIIPTISSIIYGLNRPFFMDYIHKRWSYVFVPAPCLPRPQSMIINPARPFVLYIFQRFFCL